MSNKWNNFFEALFEVCEEYNKMKTKADEKAAEHEFFSDIFAEVEPVVEKSSVVDKSSVVIAMVKHGWSSLDIKLTLRYVNTPEQAKIAIGLINNGYGWRDVRDIVNSIK